MDPRVTRLSTVDDCKKFAVNAVRLDRSDLAEQARRRAFEIRAEAYGATTEAEKECLQAIYAYEEVLSQKNGRRTRASRTWQMIDRHGILEAVARAVNRPQEATGYTALVDMGLEELAFEAVILRYPAAFSPEVVARCKERLATMVQSDTE